MLAEIVALVMLVSLIFYALLGGADFGGGVWDLLASGPRASAQRALIERALAPVWEANHVWLILVVVLLFTAFPAAYSTASIALHIPLTGMLLGIVLRGSAFAFRQYGAHDTQRFWGRVFAIASTVTPVFLGVILGAITSGDIRLEGGLPVGGFVDPWLGVFPVLVGFFALSLFAFLAAVYLAAEADDPALQDDFRLRALCAGAVVGFCALACGLAATPGTTHFRAVMLGSWWTWPLQVAAGASALTAFACLIRRRYRGARLAAIFQVILILGGWGLAQRPLLIAPDVTIANAAAPDSVLLPLLVASGVGSVVLFPSLYWLLRIFKTRQ